LDPKFDEFDKFHWWEDPSDVDPIAALYEIARRHPLVGAYQIGAVWKLSKSFFNNPIRFLCGHGLKSWPKLSSIEQKCWQKVAGNLKGVDCRDDSEKCFSIECAAFMAIKCKRAFTTKKYQKKTIEKVSRLIEEDMIKQPPFMWEMEAKIRREAVTAFRKDYLLIAVAPDLAVDNAESLMAKEYCQHRARKRIYKPRARWGSWLQLIVDFEDAEVRLGGAKSQLFTRYRRIMDGIDFP
jgi:hypothetical protein